MHMVVLLEPGDFAGFSDMPMMDQIRVSVFSTDHDTPRHLHRMQINILMNLLCVGEKHSLQMVESSVHPLIFSPRNLVCRSMTAMMTVTTKIESVDSNNAKEYRYGCLRSNGNASDEISLQTPSALLSLVRLKQPDSPNSRRDR